MASRKEQKDRARQQRLASDAAEERTRQRRLQVLGGLVIVAIVVVVVVVSVAPGGGNTAPVKPHSKQALAAVKHVDALLAGIPESGVTLGNPTAAVTVTEYGDLECSVCDEFATPPSFTNPEGEPGTGFEDDLISQYVRTGRVRLVYRPLETASSGNPNADAFALQQAAAVAAGRQNKAWYYIELFYNEQGAEGTAYVTQSFLEDVARQIHRLNFAQWMSDRKLSSVTGQVASDNARGTAITERLPDGVSTPTLLIRGVKGHALALQGLTSSTWSDLRADIASVS